MRHLINKHYDTHGGFSVILTNVSSHIKAPVSLKDETMKQTQEVYIKSFLDYEIKNTWNSDGYVLSSPEIKCPDEPYFYECHLGNYSTLRDAMESAVTYFMMKRLDIFHAQVHKRTLGTKGSHEWYLLVKVLKAEGLAMPEELTPSGGYSIEVQGGE